MSRKLTPSQRKQIISDYKNGIQNEEYRVIDRGEGKYQVRKRESQFKLPPRPETPVPQKSAEEEEEKEEKNDSPMRMSNEELLYKLSNLLQVPVKETEETPEEHDHEEEAYEEDKQYIERAATVKNPWGRRPLSLF